MTAAERDAVQAALVAAELWYLEAFGPMAGWSEAVWASWRVDVHLAERRATGWAVAS